MLGKVSRAAMVVAVALSSAPLSATVVSTLANGVSVAIPVVAGDDVESTKGPITFGPGITFTSTATSLFGYTGDYGFTPDLLWSGTSMIGLNHASGTFTLAFAQPLSGFLAEIDSTEYASSRDALISAYDSAGHLLDTITLERNDYAVAPGYWGFSYASASIARITFSNEYIGIRNISVALPAPEPTSWGMMLTGFGLIGGVLRRGRTKVNVHA